MERLENFEKALKNIINEYENLGKELEKLRNADKSKTTKFIRNGKSNVSMFNIKASSRHFISNSNTRIYATRWTNIIIFRRMVINK